MPPTLGEIFYEEFGFGSPKWVPLEKSFSSLVILSSSYWLTYIKVKCFGWTPVSTEYYVPAGHRMLTCRDFMYSLSRLTLFMIQLIQHLLYRKYIMRLINLKFVAQMYLNNETIFKGILVLLKDWNKNH